jgi:Domain of unknown function (DUF6249)
MGLRQAMEQGFIIARQIGESVWLHRRIQREAGSSGDKKMLDIDSMSGLVAVLAVILVFGTPVIIVIAILIHKARRTQRIHQTVVALAEKGLPIPPDLFVDRPSADSTSPLHKGVVLIAVGVGLTIFFLSMPDRHGAWGVGMIPLLIGVGYLIVWKLEGKKEDKA